MTCEKKYAQDVDFCECGDFKSVMYMPADFLEKETEGSEFSDVFTAKEVSLKKSTGKTIKRFEFLGKVPEKFSFGVYGAPGSRKSTIALMFADTISKRNKTLYVTTEEGASGDTMRVKLGFGNINNENILITNKTSLSEINEKLEETEAQNLIIDSFSFLRVKKASFESLRKKVPGIFVFVLHQTKTGDYKGDTFFPHACDVFARIKKPGRIIVEKNRFHFHEIETIDFFGNQDETKIVGELSREQAMPSLCLRGSLALTN